MIPQPHAGTARAILVDEDDAGRLQCALDAIDGLSRTAHLGSSAL
jgi:hypothetical protein